MLNRHELLGWVLDFEGCISIGYETSSGRPKYKPIVKVTTTSYEHLRHFERKVNFGHTNPEPQFRPAGRKSAFNWYLSALEIETELPQTLEFLFLKRQQAELVLELISMKMPRDTSYFERNQHSTPDVVARKHALYLECQRLNERGDSKPLTAQEVMLRALKQR